MNFSVLGPIKVSEAEHSLDIGGPKQRTVLAMLIAGAGRIVLADSIAEAVYGDELPERYRRNVQTYVSTLRAVVGDSITKDGDGWVFVAETSQVDALEFEELCVSAVDMSELDAGAAGSVLRDALALWRGHPYAGIEAHGLLGAEVARLNEMRVTAQSARIDADLASGRSIDLIGEIEGLIAQHPYNERFRAQHMIALYRAGRQRDALGSFADMRSTLVEELGLDPTRELQDLEQRILDQNPSLDLASPKTIEVKAVLVADPGDATDMGVLSSSERNERLARMFETLRRSAEANQGGEVRPAGTASYATFDSPLHAIAAAESVGLELADTAIRFAVDWGDIEMSDDGIAGPPVTRAAVLVSIAHPGQILLSQDAQRAVMADGEGAGVRIESLGSFDLQGIEARVPIYQLLVGDPARSFPDPLVDRIPPPLPQGDQRSVPGYELRDSVGHGSVGTLHRAYQPSIGREVLLEVIDRTRSSDAGFIRYFEANTQRLTAMDHPNISSPLDYWRDGQGAYVAYRLHRGGFLDVTDADPERVLRQVGDALVYAHSLGVVHGSVRPDRIALDEAGNAYLLGFPIEENVYTSSPEFAAYIAPETMGYGQPTPAADVYSLGVLAHELFAGREAPADLPIESDSPAIARALSDDPADRYASVVSFLEGLLPDSSGAAQRRYTATRNPYKGLSTFVESDADDFFGRSDVVAEIIAAVRDSGVVAVVGPSGVGKSSVVRAGLLPALRAGGLPGSQNWVVAGMYPGVQPFRELERALEQVAVALPGETRHLLTVESTESLTDIASALPEGADLVLFVDQFEEIFTMSDGTAVRRFLDLITRTRDLDGVHVVITLRADFLGRALQYSGFREVLQAGMVVVGSPNPEELAETVNGPATRVGVRVDPAVTERVVASVKDHASSLPLLQHTMSELFQMRGSDVITLADYDEIGGVTGSLAMRAESIFGDLDDAERETARQLFLRLVDIQGNGTVVRSRVRVSDLEALGAGSVANSFVGWRLLVLDSDTATRIPTVEVAHEALFLNWPRLSRWIEDVSEDLVLRRRLEDSVDEWIAHDRDDAYLLTGTGLDRHLAWTGDTELSLSEEELRYVGASRDARTSFVERSRRRRRAVLAGFASAALVAAVLALWGLRSSNDAQNAAAEARSRELMARSMAAIDDDPELSLMLALDSVDTEVPSFESVQTIRAALREHRTVFSLSWDQPLFWTAIASISADGRLLSVTGEQNRVEVWDIQSDTPAMIWSYEAPWLGGLHIQRPQFTLDGEYLTAAVYWLAGTNPELDIPELPPGPGLEGLYVWDATSGDLVDVIEGPCGPMLHSQRAEWIDVREPVLLMPDTPIENNRPAAAACDSGALPEDTSAPLLETIWFADLTTGEIVGEREVAEDFLIGSVLPGGLTALLTYPGRSEIIVIVSGEVVRTFDSPPVPIGITPAGDAFISPDPPALIDPDTFEIIGPFTPPPGGLAGSFSGDGSVYVRGAERESVVVWNVPTNMADLALKGHNAQVVLPPSITVDGTRVATGAPDRTVRVWSLDPWTAELGGFSLADGFHVDASVDLVGSRGVSVVYPTAGRDLFDLTNGFITRHAVGQVVVFDYPTGDVEMVLDGIGGKAARISPDGTAIAAQTSSNDGFGPVVVFNIGSGERLAEMEGTCVWVLEGATPTCTTGSGIPIGAIDLDFSPDGSMLAAAGGASQRLLVWDSETGRQAFESDPLGSFPTTAVQFSPDGTIVAVSSKSGTWIFDTATWDEMEAIEHVGKPSWAIRFTNDGRQLLAAQAHTGTIGAYSTDTWTLQRTLEVGPGQIRDLEVNEDDSLIVTASSDGSVHVIELETGRLVDRIELRDDATNVAFVDDDAHLLVTAGSGPVEVYTLDANELIEIAASRVTRGYSEDECEAFFIGIECPTAR
ncbi:MAG: protein kinase [Gammaproteobacteria bacterium]|nr:protein kinase [Gammaproteobacteria bacterium]